MFRHSVGTWVVIGLFSISAAGRVPVYSFPQGQQKALVVRREGILHLRTTTPSKTSNLHSRLKILQKEAGVFRLELADLGIAVDVEKEKVIVRIQGLQNESELTFPYHENRALLSFLAGKGRITRTENSILFQEDECTETEEGDCVEESTIVGEESIDIGTAAPIETLIVDKRLAPLPASLQGSSTEGVKVKRVRAWLEKRSLKTRKVEAILTFGPPQLTSAEITFTLLFTKVDDTP